MNSYKKYRTTLFIIILLISRWHNFSQEQTVNLLFLGDIMGHGPQIQAAYDPLTKTYNYSDNFQYIKPIFDQADITIANLEVTLGTKPYKGYPQFSSPPELAIAIKNAGIDVLGTSNNHACDRGRAGIESTIDVLDSLGIAHMGTYKNQIEKSRNNPLILYQNGINIALLNYTYDTNGIPVPKPNVVNLLDKDIIAADVAQAKTQNPDVIIAFVHWGEQYRDLPVDSQKEWFTYFKSLGVNIVIGSHPHVVEPMLWNKEDSSLVVYSLGNFVSNQRQYKRDGGAMFSLTLKRNDKGKVIIEDASYILHWVYKKTELGQVTYHVLPIDEFQYKKYFFPNSADYRAMMLYKTFTENLLEKYNLNIRQKEQITVFLQWLMDDIY